MLNYILIAVFATVFFTVVALYLLLRDRLGLHNRRVKQRLDSLADDSTGENEFLRSIVRDDKLSKIPFLHRLLAKFQFSKNLQTLIDQAGMPVNASTVLLAILSLAGMAFILVLQLFNLILLAIVTGLICGLIPYLYILRKRTKRIRAFNELLPDALDIIMNALKVGFSFESALTMVAEEIPDPLGIEIAITFQEQNLGKELSEALANLRKRMPSDDLNLFITSLLIHKTTGGNLAEVLEKTAKTIRDRFRFQREVRTKTAHSRLSGIVLVILPLAMVGIIMALNPEYFMVLIDEKAGNYALGIALAMQVAGFLIIRRIVNIRL
ncbi:MAG: type II secretion system F family protein [candidate division Zixibacteria bacterium]|nr:type II secretion system F family protein [candidate division Zixibacteria bacterium]